MSIDSVSLVVKVTFVRTNSRNALGNTWHRKWDGMEMLTHWEYTWEQLYYRKDWLGEFINIIKLMILNQVVQSYDSH